MVLDPNSRLDLPFTGITSFCKWPICTDLNQLDADVAVLGVPYDMSTQYRPGARFGPRGIRDGSTIYSLGKDGAYDPERDEVYLDNKYKFADCGDVDIFHGNQERSHDSIRTHIRKIVSHGAIPIVLGGDHSITAPVVEAMDNIGEFAVIHFDAHLDFVDIRGGNRYGHGSPIRRVYDCEHVKGIAQLGIRGIGSSKREDFEEARKCGNVILSTRDIRKIGIAETLNRLPEFEQFYLTIDCDSLNPAIAPGTGSPSPGGFDYYEIEELLEGITQMGRLVGMDFVEVAPAYDLTGLTNQVAARIILDAIGFSLNANSKKETSIPK